MRAGKRLLRTLNHNLPDRICVEIGAGGKPEMELYHYTNKLKLI
jgi:hypothetical protein